MYIWMMCVSTTVPQCTGGAGTGRYLNKITGSYGAAFSYQIQANRGPDTYEVTVGTLPTGLSLDGSTGIISGTPSATGDFTVTVKVAYLDSKNLFFRINRGT